MFTLTVAPNHADLLPLEWLQLLLPRAPRAYLRQLLRAGKIRRDGLPIGETTHLHAGEVIVLPTSERLRELATPAPTILCEHELFLAIAKPAGVAMHAAGAERDTLLERVAALVRERGAPYRVAPAHRLDRDTSGVVLFGKGRRGAAALGKLFMAGAVDKRYLALVHGVLTGNGTIDLPVTAKGTRKEARTCYSALAGNGNVTLLELLLDSGRTHQIRQHLAAIGHPLLGERRYGTLRQSASGRLFLHCHRLAFPAPDDATQRLSVSAPLPAELVAELQRHGLNAPVWVTTACAPESTP